MTAENGQTGKWPLAGLFIALALPGLLLVWWFAIYNATPPQRTGKLAYMLVPVLAAGVAGWFWRGHMAASPEWRMRRPYSRLMAYLLFAAVTMVLPFLMPALALIAEGQSLREAWPAITALAASTLPRGLPALIAVMLGNLLLCLIQTEIGMSLGVWIRGRMMRASADQT